LKILNVLIMKNNVLNTNEYKNKILNNFPLYLNKILK